MRRATRPPCAAVRAAIEHRSARAAPRRAIAAASSTVPKASSIEQRRRYAAARLCLAGEALCREVDLWSPRLLCRLLSARRLSGKMTCAVKRRRQCCARRGSMRPHQQLPELLRSLHGRAAPATRRWRRAPPRRSAPSSGPRAPPPPWRGTSATSRRRTRTSTSPPTQRLRICQSVLDCRRRSRRFPSRSRRERRNAVARG